MKEILTAKRSFGVTEAKQREWSEEDCSFPSDKEEEEEEELDEEPSSALMLDEDSDCINVFSSGG
jgi:hypothetical protein